MLKRLGKPTSSRSTPDIYRTAAADLLIKEIETWMKELRVYAMRVRTSPRSRRATTLLWGPWYLSGALSAYTYCCDFIIVGCAKYIFLDFYILNFLTMKENFSFFTNNHQCKIKTWPKFEWGQSIRWPLP